MENFRQNIKEGYLPMPTDITYEGGWVGSGVCT